MCSQSLLDTFKVFKELPLAYKFCSDYKLLRCLFHHCTASSIIVNLTYSDSALITGSDTAGTSTHSMRSLVAGTGTILSRTSIRIAEFSANHSTEATKTFKNLSKTKHQKSEKNPALKT